MIFDEAIIHAKKVVDTYEEASYREEKRFGELRIGQSFIDDPIGVTEYFIKVSENEARACVDDMYVGYNPDEVVIAIHPLNPNGECETSDFEKCCQDLDRWNIHYETGFFYEDEVACKKWIRIGGEHGQNLVFTPKGEITDLGDYMVE